MIQWILHSYARHYWQSPCLFCNVSDLIDHHLKDQDDHERAERFCIRLSALKSPSHPSEQAFSAKKIFQTKRIVYSKQFENSLFKISNAAKLFEKLIVESVLQRPRVWWSNHLDLEDCPLDYMATLFIAYRPKSESANPFQIPIIDSTCALAWLCLATAQTWDML